MSVYPTYYSGLRLTAALLTAGQPDLTLKTAATPRTNSTLTDDPELAGIPLAVGSWWIRMHIWASNTVTTGNIKTQWSFTGTWNTPLRHCAGPDVTTGGPSDITEMKLQPFATTTDAVYDLGASAAYTGITEYTASAVVSVAGNLALAWAQNVTNATATNVQPGSFIEVRRIA